MSAEWTLSTSHKTPCTWRNVPSCRSYLTERPFKRYQDVKAEVGTAESFNLPLAMKMPKVPMASKARSPARDHGRLISTLSTGPSPESKIRKSCCYLWLATAYSCENVVEVRELLYKMILTREQRTGPTELLQSCCRCKHHRICTSYYSNNISHHGRDRRS